MTTQEPPGTRVHAVVVPDHDPEGCADCAWLDGVFFEVRAERDMVDVAYSDLRKAALRVIEATQPTERDAAILDLDCVVHNGDPCEHRG